MLGAEVIHAIYNNAPIHTDIMHFYKEKISFQTTAHRRRRHLLFGVIRRRQNRLAHARTIIIIMIQMDASRTRVLYNDVTLKKKYGIVRVYIWYILHLSYIPTRGISFMHRIGILYIYTVVDRGRRD